VYAGKEVSTESDLKKRADKLFSDENYESALPDYSRLLSLYPGQTYYNYRYGVCLLMAGKEKTSAATYLENASKDARADEEVWYYLGKSYINNNDFSRAKDAFMQFKKIANTTKQKKYEIDACILNCENGLVLSKQRKTIVIQKSDDVNRSNFYTNYFFDNAPGKIVATADQFLTTTDRLKQKEPVMYIGNDKKRVFFASYGNTEDNGKDIYLIKRSADNMWGEPENIGSVINTSADEDFAFLDRDGRTLYFSSKGHNSIGGYDIFKSVYNFNTKEWSQPENLGIPINTPGDDMLFVMDENGKTATYSTNIETTSKNVSVRKIEVPKGMSDLRTISGVYVPQDQQMRRDARISILNSSGDGIVTSVHTDPVSGKYEFSLTPGQNYMIVVEGGGYLPHAEMFDFPEGLPDSGLKQVVRINKDDQKEELTLVNYFSKNGSSEPSRTFSRSYATNVDESSLMRVQIGDQVVYVTPPEKQEASQDVSPDNQTSIKNTEPVTTSEQSSPEVKDSTSLPTITLKKKDEYDPTLQTGPTSDEIKQKEEEEARKKDIAADEVAPEKEFNDNVSNEELARIAYDEARELQVEADSMNNEVVSLREQAAEKENYSVIYKNKADAIGVDRDSAASLKSQSQAFHSESKDLLKAADGLAIDASEKDAEAKTAIDEANEIFNNPSAATASAGKKKKSSGVTKANPKTSQPDLDVPLQNGNNQPGENISATDSKNKSQNNDVAVAGTKINGQDKDTSRIDNHPANSLDEETSLTDHAEKISEKSNSHEKNEDVSNDELKYDENEVVNLIIKGKDIPGMNSNDSTKTATTNESTVKTGQENISDSVRINESLASEPKNEALPIKEEQINSDESKNENLSALNSDNKVNSSLKNILSNEPDKVDSTNAPVNIESQANNIQNTTEETNDTSTNLKDILTNTSENSARDKNNNTNLISENQKTDSSIESGDSKNTVQKTANNTKPADESIAQSNAATIKNDSGEAPKLDNPSIIQLSDDPKTQAMPVKPEAVQLFREYQTLLKHSNDLTKQSVSMQEEVSRLVSSPKRDSLIRASNELTLTSIHEWQEGLKKIQEARKIDPGVEYKMNVNDYAATRGKNNDGESLSLEKSSDDTVLEANANTNKTPEIKSLDAADHSTVSKLSEAELEANIDKSNPDYPKYVSLKNDVQKGQVETINVFADAIRISKLASEERDLEGKLMDQARMETDSAKKADLIRQSFEHKAQAEKYESDAKEKFAEAQKHTNEVKGLKVQLAALLERISKPGQNSTMASANTKTGSETEINSQKFNTNKSKNVSQPVADIKGSERELSVNENEIAKVNVGKSEMDNFMKTVFNKDPSFSYSDKNPIPMDPELPEGLVFKVQIGAFRTQLPADKFRGIQPLTGETTRPGWIRYCAGLFRAFEPANIVKKDIQKMGYKDAFVVAYYNGKRIELNDAYKMIRERQDLTAYKDASAKEVAILKKMNINDDRSISTEDDNDVKEFFGGSSSSDNTTGLSTKEFTVQVGVFNTTEVPSRISAMSPLQYLKTNSNKFKFTFGRFNNRRNAESAKIYAINAGVKDAFIIPFRKGTPVNQAEPESDISSVANSINNAVSPGTVHANNSSTADINSEIEEVVTTNGKVSYKVQIGAYKTNIPYNLVESYVSIMDKGITHKTDDRGLHIFYVGNFENFKQASALLQEVLSKGVKDAFVVALKDGKRIPLTDEMKK
jgi:hypothetical protein